MSEPAVSAVIPCFNTRACIADAVRSALTQKDHSVEVIVVDDGSSDGSASFVEETFRSDERVRVVALPENRGPSAARNVGFAAARGTWIGLLDSDDIWRPDRLARLLVHQDEADFIADNLMGFDSVAGIETGPVYEGLSDRELHLLDFIIPSAPDRHDFGYLQPLIRRRFLRDHNIKYREDVRAGEDLLLNLSILAAGGRAVYVDEPLYVYATPVGAVSRGASPHSRSTADTQPLIKALEEFLGKTAARLSEDERDAFAWRLDDLRTQRPIGAFHRARANGRIGEMLMLAVREPAVRRKILCRLLGRSSNKSRSLAA